uniref:Uncharacterized protein n=1 Tax=Lutzomyia longipalpis TaxID=7200 RepID=A0A1B0GJ73_LUTLO
MENPEGESEAVAPEQPVNNVDGKHSEEDAAPKESEKVPEEEKSNNVDGGVNEEHAPEVNDAEESQEEAPEAAVEDAATTESVKTPGDVEMRDVSDDTQEDPADVHQSEEVNVAEGVPQTEEEKEEQLRQLQEPDPFAATEHADEPMETTDISESVDGASQSPSCVEEDTTSKQGQEDEASKPGHEGEESSKQGQDEEAEQEAHKSGDEGQSSRDHPEESTDSVARDNEEEEEHSRQDGGDSQGVSDQGKDQSYDLFDCLRSSETNEQPRREATDKPDSSHPVDSDDDDNHAGDEPMETSVDDRGDDEGNAADESTAQDVTADESGDIPDEEESRNDQEEDVCLIPDEEREISEAEREALLAQEAAEKERESTVEDTEMNEDQRQTDDAPHEGPSEGAGDENDITHETSTQQDSSMEVTESTTLAPNEIREEAQATKDPVECLQCKKSLNCVFSVLQEGEVKNLCSFECVDAFKAANTDKEFTLNLQKLSIYIILETGKTCIKYRFKKTANAEYSYICDQTCLNSFIPLQTEQKCVVIRRKYLIEEVPTDAEEQMNKCYQCTDDKVCKFIFRQDDDEFFLCQEDCVNLLLLEQPDRFRLKHRTTVRVRDLPKESGGSATVITNATSSSADHETFGPDSSQLVARTPEEVEQARIEREQSFLRVCVQCFSQITPNDKSIIWETMDYCNEQCLQTYQTMMLSTCSLCGLSTPATSIGKYCVRFGYQIRQFCQTSCFGCLQEGSQDVFVLS